MSFVSLVIIAINIRQKPRAILNVSTSSPRMTDIAVPNTDSSVSITAACAGGVMGDHCSPISDTTIMASAGAHCYHLNHVFTQLPYALTVAAVSFVSFILAGLIQNVFVNLLIAVVLMVGTLLVIRAIVAKKHAGIFQEMAEADKALAK